MSRFRYHASAVGASGTLEAPYARLIPAQASAALPDSGGVAHNVSGRFDCERVLRFDAIRTELVGRYDEKDGSYETLVTVSIERLNILDMVTADRIVARLVSKHPKGQEARINLTGSHFENLRVAGQVIEPKLATDVFSRVPTYGGIANALYGRTAPDCPDPKAEADANVDIQSLLAQQWSLELRKNAPERVSKFLPEAPAREFEKTNQPFSCSLVRSLGETTEPVRCYGNIIEVEGFGVVRLYDLDIGRNWKRLTMLHANLGCAYRAEMDCASVAGNGDDW